MFKLSLYKRHHQAKVNLMSKKLFKSTFIVASMTFLSRVLGLVREVVFASTFGANAGMDAFLVAFKIPNFFRRLFAEGAFSQAFVPVLSEHKTKDSRDELRAFIAHVAGTLAAMVFVVAVIGSLCASVWVFIFAPGFIQEPEKYALAKQLLRITFPYLFFISLTALSGGILNTFNRFSVPALTPVILNVCLIVATLFFAHDFAHPVNAAAWGVLVAGFLQLAFQLPFLYRLGLLVWPKWGLYYPGVRRIMTLMVPALFGASVAQLSLLIDTLFASFLPTGSVSWLYYADRLMQFPLGVFGVALSTVILPYLAKSHAEGKPAVFSAAIAWAIKLIILVAVPAATGLWVLSGPLLTALFHYGAFSLQDVARSRQCLMAFSLGVVFFILVKVLVSSYYAAQDMKTPVKMAVIALLVNVILNAILIWPLQVAGLALSTSIASMVNVTLLLYGMHVKRVFRFGQEALYLALKTIVACAFMYGVLTVLVHYVGPFSALSMLHRLADLGMMILLGGLSYFGVLFALGVRKHHIVY